MYDEKIPEQPLTDIWKGGIWYYESNQDSGLKEKYYLYNKTSNNVITNTPNSGKTTYFVESVLVTLGGGKTVYTGGSSTSTSGSFKAR